MRRIVITLIGITGILLFAGCSGPNSTTTITYGVTVSPSGDESGESVSVDVSEAAEGATVTLTASLNSARQVALSASGVTISPSTISTDGGTATFTMPAEEVDVTATFTDIVYATGDTGPAGGIIFYVDETDAYSWNYLEVAPASTEVSVIWGGYGTTVSGASGMDLGTGTQNTDLIVAAIGDTDPSTGTSKYAAKYCSDLEEGGQDDWFLPSKNELDVIWDNLVDDGTVGGFADAVYWSSTQGNQDTSWAQDFTNGDQSYPSKSYCNRVRAIRSF